MQLFFNRQPTVDVMTDACPHAARGYFQGDWFYFNFIMDDAAWFPLHINHKETLAIVLAAKCWAPVGLTIVSSSTVITKRPCKLSTKVPQRMRS